MHLQECEHFECNLNFKCQRYYCIPWSYLCDGKWDCPEGQDESSEEFCGKNRICNNMFHCRKSQICVSTEDVCNNIKDCPLGDDEELCEIFTIQCPSGCVCLNFAIVCLKLNIKQSIMIKLPYISFHIVYSKQVTLVPFIQNSQAIVLNLTHNLISNVCPNKPKPLHMRPF